MNERPDFARLMQGVIPYLAIDGADKAIDFYKRAFGAVQHADAVKAEDGRIMNVGLEINGGTIMLMDPFPEGGTCAGNKATGQGLSLQLIIMDGDFWWNRAIEAGCEVTQPFKQEFWGDRYGRVRDPFGLEWAFNEPGAANRAS